VVALARQRSAEEPDLVADDVAAGRSGDAERRDAELGGPCAQERPADAGCSSTPGRGRCARLAGRSGLAAVPERQQSAQGPADTAEAVDGLGVDHGRHWQQRRHAAGDQVQLSRGVRAGVAVGQMAADPLGLLVAGDVSHVGVEVATRASTALPVVVVLHQVAQARPGALGDLAELLDRPAKALAELVAVHTEGYLARQDEALVGGQLVGELAQASQVMACGHMRVDVCGRVGELRKRRRRIGVWSAIAATQGVVQGSFHRAAAANSTLAVADPRQEPLLQRVGDVPIAGERRRARASASNKLERRLAEAVLEVLATEAVAMHAQQHVALGRRYLGHRLGWIAPRSKTLMLHDGEVVDETRSRGIPCRGLIRLPRATRDRIGSRPGQNLPSRALDRPFHALTIMSPSKTRGGVSAIVCRIRRDSRASAH
jgi:hypothetical protein